MVERLKRGWLADDLREMGSECLGFIVVSGAMRQVERHGRGYVTARAWEEKAVK